MLPFTSAVNCVCCRWIFDIDADEDGSVTVEEITKWILRNDDLANSQEAELQWSLYDTDKDGNVTWKEYQRIFIKSTGRTLLPY